ncbi:hypothetical protein FACS1894142_5680 [Spirochaetia bacterium]|nr:hypothetical protein FACS1894142_5680 [Spirochaetia bacterium]
MGPENTTIPAFPAFLGGGKIGQGQTRGLWYFVFHTLFHSADCDGRQAIHRTLYPVDSYKEKDRRLIFLKYYEGLNATEIGRIEGLPPGTVRRRLSVIMAYMKTQLGGMYEN